MVAAREYLESRGWRYEFQSSEDDPRRWLRDGHNLTETTALWIEWQDLAQCFAECVVAARVGVAFNDPAVFGRVDKIMQAALDKHRIDIKIKDTLKEGP